MNGSVGATTTRRERLSRAAYPLTVLILLVLVVALPPLATRIFDINPDTPYNLALETLDEKYGLEPIDALGEPVGERSASLSVSQFRAVEGSVTEDVPFYLDGHAVSCTVDMPTDDPESVTAVCTRP